MADARKLFRLFKWVNEYQKTVDFLDKPPTDWDEIDLIINVLTRVSFAGFWAFDNLFILSKLKIIRRNPDSFKKPTAFCWWLGIVFTLIFTLRKLMKLKNEESQLNKLIM